MDLHPYDIARHDTTCHNNLLFYHLVIAINGNLCDLHDYCHVAHMIIYMT
jgi:hypothetical protein